jgi:DNA-binding HxlR family transcriptional regulator
MARTHRKVRYLQRGKAYTPVTAARLRQMERDGMVPRILHPQVPPKVEYALTDWAQALCPALDALPRWAALREEMADGVAMAGKE